MTRKIAACILVIGLAACGANGEPDQPAANDGSTGVRVSGDARVGISVSGKGVHPHAQVGLGQGPVWLQVGF